MIHWATQCDWKDRCYSFLLGGGFFAAWLAYPYFSGMSGDSEVIQSFLFHVIWTVFFVGGALYMMYEAIHTTKSHHHEHLHSHPHSQHPVHHPVRPHHGHGHHHS